MQALLQKLNGLPGVRGSMRCDGDGQPVAQALPPGQPDSELRAAAAAAADSLRALGDAAGAPVHLDLHYSQRRVLVVPDGKGALVLVCDKGVNPRNVLPHVAELLRAAAGGAPATAPGSTPAPVARPRGVTPPEVTPAPAALARGVTPPPAPLAAASSGPGARRRPSAALLAAIGGAVVVLGGVAAWAFSRPGPAAAPEAQVAAAPPAEAAAPAIVLRIGGAKSFAAELAPALAKGYLEALELKDVKVQKLDAVRATVTGEKDGARLAVAIEGMNTPDGFDQLAAGKLDVAMAGRRIKPEWQAKLAAHGSMMVPGREHVVALSGIAVIVNPANGIAQLTREQLADVFSGEITDWAAVGGRRDAGPIHVYAGDDRMGLTDLFKTLVLEKRAYGPEVKRLATLQEITDAVALDPAAIGYVTLPFVRGTRAVPLAEADAAALVPTAFTLATEDYLLTHRLYFYALPRAEDPHVLKFIQYALSSEGQAVVKRSGYVELSVAAAPRAPPEGAPREYVRLTGEATRLSSTFRFEPGSSEFDVRALVDLERVTAYLVEHRLNGAAVRVLGFADGQGKRAVNDALSAARAEQVARALAQRGISGVQVAGFGSALPVATNATAEGRDRNRRVEVWVQRAGP